MKYLNRNIINTFLRISVPILLLWSMLIIVGMVDEKEYVINYAIKENEMHDKNTAILVNRYLEEIIENLKVLRDSDEMNQHLKSQNEHSRKQLENMFIRIISNKEDYDQIRFIDNKGLEVVRVNRKDDIFATEEGELQNKFDRYYFQETIALNYDDVYLSPLDLNMENGEIEMPLNPMIRIGTPVFSTENQLLGIVIINYKADYFLNILKNHEEHEEFYASKFYILNKAGQFIIHPNSDYNFSFMYDDKEKISFEDEYIDLWQNMESNDFIGSYLDNHTVVTYYDLLNISLDKSDNENKWIMVHMMDASNLLSFHALVNNLILSRNGIISFIILVIVYAIAIVIERLKNRELELDITKEIATSTNDAIIITDSKTRITYVNEMYEQYTGYSSNEVLGLKPSMFKSGKHNSEFYREMWSSINTKGHWEGTLWDKKKNGMLYPKKLKIIAVNDNRRNANPHHYVGIFSDISAIKESCDQYEILNYKNGKRLIPNEKIMMDLLQESIKNEKFHFMILYLSIENYSQLANTFEEQNIDLAKAFMELAQPFIKNDDLIAQTGKNLFAIIIGIHNIEGSTHEYVTNLHRNLSKVINIKGKDVFFKSKLGVSHWPQDTEDIKKLLMNSMIALEWTSKRGDSEISYYKDFMIDELNQESEIESQLKNAIEKKEFSMVYQPQVDIQSNKVIGMEALLRWNNEFLGNISPAVFIPIAEKNHLMIDIGDWIINQVCEDINYLNKQDVYKNMKLRCAVNLSAIQIESVDFHKKLMNAISKNGLKCSQLEMELTESAILNNKNSNIQLIDKIRESGMTVAIDDFGTGYSSLSYLNTLPIDKIKIDRSFIKNYPDTDDGKLISILVDMSKKLNLKVLTEGAESVEQVEFLKEMGCNYIQGYYYSKPLKLNEFLDYIVKKI